MNKKMLLQPKSFGKEGAGLPIFFIVLFTIFPLLYSSAVFDPTQNLHITVGLFLIIVISIIAMYNKKKSIIVINYIDVAWVAYIIYNLQGLIHSKDISIAFFETSKIIFTYFLFILIRFFCNKKNYYMVIALSVSFVILFESAIVFCQKIIGLDIYGSSSNFFGTVTHINILSECIVFSFPLTIYGIIKSNDNYKKIISAIGLVSSFILIISLKTRAVWVSFTIASIVVFILVVRNYSFKKIFVKLQQHKLLIALTASVMILLFCIYILNDIKDFVFHIQSLFKFDSDGRFIIWASTIPVIKEHFWLGVGPGNYRFYIPKLIGAFIQRPHNDYLWILSEAGIFGLIAFLTILLLTFKKIFDNNKNLHGEELFLNHLALFGLICYCVDSFFAFPKERAYNLVFFAFFTAVPFSLNPPKKVISVIKLKFLAPFMICIAAIFIVFNCYRFNGERLLKVVVSKPYLSPAERLSIFQRIEPWVYKVDPFTIPVKYYEAMVLLEKGNLQGAKNCFREAYNIYPYQPDVLLNLGTACELTGEHENAKRFYCEAIEADTGDFRPKINLAIIEFKDNNITKSADIIRSIDTNVIKDQPQFLARYNILKNSLRNHLQY